MPCVMFSFESELVSVLKAEDVAMVFESGKACMRMKLWYLGVSWKVLSFLFV
jgi:hypothetical protein